MNCPVDTQTTIQNQISYQHQRQITSASPASHQVHVTSALSLLYQLLIQHSVFSD